MSNAGQAALGIVGGIIGFFVGGGPVGAAYGFQIGLAVGSVVSPTQLPGTFGPKLADKRTTTAQLGTPIAEAFGTDVVSGTVIWLGDVVEIATTEEVGGKGGPEGESTTFTYTQSIAVGLCRGPMVGLLRIWENGKLVYDARARLLGEDDSAYFARIGASATYAETFVLYVGDETQLPDPTIELKEGIGNVPAYRGLMYIVFPDRLLRDDQALRHPSYKFEVSSLDVVTPNTPVAARTEVSSFTFTAGHSIYSSNQIGFVLEPFDPVGTIDAPGTINLAGGVTGTIRNCFFQGLTFPPLFFAIGVGGPFTLPLITSVLVFTGLPGGPLLFDVGTAHSSGTNAVGVWPLLSAIDWATADAPFINGIEYTVVVNSTLPAGYESVGTLSAGGAEPSGVGFVGGSGNFDAEIAVSADSAVAVAELYVVGFSGSRRVYFLLDAALPALQIALLFAGENGQTVLGPRLGGVSAGQTRFEWDCGGLSIFAVGSDYEITVLAVDAEAVIPVTTVSLADIVTSICARCGLTAIDVEDLEPVLVGGYKIERLTDGRSAIAVLRQIGFFDAVESGTAGVKFPTRGKPPVRTLTLADLGAHESGNDPPASVTTSSTQDVELPRQLFVQHRDPARDYEDGQQASPARLITDAINDSYVDVAVAIDATQALRAAEMLWADQWAGRWKHSLSIDAAHADLEPTDCVLVPIDGRLERLRIVAIEDAAVVLRSLSLVRDDDGSYVSVALADPPAAPPAVLIIRAGTLLVLLDLPPLRAADNDAGIYAAVQRLGGGSTWGGAGIYRGDLGGPLSAVASVTSEAVVGEVTLALPAGPHAVFDNASELVIDIPRGQFESRPDDDLLEDGANALAIGAHGRWELLQFGEAQQLGPTTWLLTHLLRGRRGTEHNIGTSETGDTAVLVSGLGVVRLPLISGSVGTTLVYRGVTVGATLGSGTDQIFASTGEALKPFSVVHVTGTDVGGDLLIEWTRRDRLAVAFTDPLPLSESPEAYEIEVLDGTVLRTLTSSVPSVTYTAAQMIADFGSPPTSVSVRIYQIGSLGRGHVTEATV